MSAPSRAVFLSYASEDSEAAARIAGALGAAGVEVWFDREELRGGDAWDQQIRRQIHACRLFLPIISAHTEARLEGYFRREWKQAVDRTADMAGTVAFLIPVCIDDTRNSSAEVPDEFHRVQWTRLPGAVPTEAFVKRISALIDGGGAQAPAPGAASPSVGTSALTIQSHRIAWSLAAIVALLVVAGSGWWLWRSARTSPPAGTASITSKSIAVLPFTDLSEKHDQQYFADGLADELLDLLAKIPGLHVVGRTSSFQFRDRADDVRKVGAALGAAYVLEGSVRRSGDQIRVTAQLISAGDGLHRWSDTFSGTVNDIFQLQDSIAADLGRSLEVTVSSDDTRKISKPEAYELFLQAKQALDSGSEEGTNRAIALLKEASRLDPQSSRIFSTLATAYNVQGSEGWEIPSETFPLAKQVAEQSLKLDSNNWQAHDALALAAVIYEWNWAKAEQELEAALQLGGRDAETLVIGAQILGSERKYDRALNLASEALAKDPLSADAHMTIGAWINLRTGKYLDAEREIRRALQIRPRWGTGQYFLSTALLMQGKLEEAMAEAQREAPRDGRYEGTSAVLHAMHRESESDEALKQAIAQNQSDWPSSIAKVYAFRGQKDEAFKWLDRAVEFRDEDLYWSGQDPLLLSLRSDPRYKTLMHKLHLPD